MLMRAKQLARAFSSSRPPWRSCTLALVISTTRSSPVVSTAMCRLRPLTFFPAS
jgi:hypothetical protein